VGGHAQKVLGTVDGLLAMLVMLFVRGLTSMERLPGEG
jgi:hypothetical protein